MNKKKRNYYFEMIDVFNFVVRWQKPLIIICSVSAVLAIIISSPFIIKPRFKSMAVFYPSTNNSISTALFADTKGPGKDPLEFGDITIAQQYVQILESDYLKFMVINRYSLMDHYHIKPDDKEKNYKILKYYEKYISVKKNPLCFDRSYRA